MLLAFQIDLINPLAHFTNTKEYKLDQADQALHDLNDGKVKGRAVLIP